jgi:hypothetical protein
MVQAPPIYSEPIEKREFSVGSPSKEKSMNTSNDKQKEERKQSEKSAKED